MEVVEDATADGAPPDGRLVSLGFGLACLVMTFMVAMGILTVQSLYRGHFDWRAASTARGTATVGACGRVGPVSWSGFGYWWTCDVLVSLPDGRKVRTSVGSSIVKPEDRGRRVRFVEVCDEPGHRECRYAREGDLLLGTGVGLLTLVFRGVVFVGLVIGGAALLRAALGHREFARRFAKRRRSTAGDGGLRDLDEPVGELPAGNGLLKITLRYPSSERERAWYDPLVPVLSIDGAEREERGWGVHRLVLPAGRHRVMVRVPYGSLTDLGRAQLRIMITDGRRETLAYRAPENPARAGLLCPERGFFADSPDDNIEISWLRLFVVLGLCYGLLYLGAGVLL